jgi:hypothetical protein
MSDRDLIDIAIVTIFAREMLEGTIIMGQYKTVIMRSPDIPKPSYGAIFAPHTLLKFLIFLTVQILHRLL